MKTISRILSIIVIITIASCSSYDTKVSSVDNFEKVEFPDGSVALLNKNSSIEYNKDFEQRIVKQDGEVFYKVTKGSNPFTVQTEDGEIEVLGTEFNVISHKKHIEIEVVSGSVKLKIGKIIKKILKGQSAFYKGNKNGIKIGKAHFKHNKWIHSHNKFFKKSNGNFNKNNNKNKNKNKKNFKKK